MRATLVTAILLAATMSVGAEGRGVRAGVTTMTFSAGHGTQVEYLGGDGRSYLWYPGNTTVVEGRWREGPTATGRPAVCFAYQANAYNPVTGSGGGRWECEPQAIYSRGVVDRAAGDVFGLARRTDVPFQLDPQRTTLRALLGRT